MNGMLQALDAYPVMEVPPSPGIEPDEAPQWAGKPSKGSRGAMHVHAYAPAITPKLNAGEILPRQKPHLPRLISTGPLSLSACL